MENRRGATEFLSGTGENREAKGSSKARAGIAVKRFSSTLLAVVAPFRMFFESYGYTARNGPNPVVPKLSRGWESSGGLNAGDERRRKLPETIQKSCSEQIEIFKERSGSEFRGRRAQVGLKPEARSQRQVSPLA
jgi:hypothetical protein